MSNELDSLYSQLCAKPEAVLGINKVVTRECMKCFSTCDHRLVSVQVDPLNRRFIHVQLNVALNDVAEDSIVSRNWVCQRCGANTTTRTRE